MARPTGEPRDRAVGQQPGGFRRRLTVAFVLVAGGSAAALAIGAYALVQASRLDDSLQRAESDVRFQLVVAREFLPVDDERSQQLLGSFEQSGRHVVLVRDARAVTSNPSFAPIPSAQLRTIAAAGQVGYERGTSGGQQLLLVGGRIPGSSAELYLIYVEDGIRADLRQLATVLVGGWVGIVAVATLVGTLIARRTLGPVARASAAARAVAEGLLDTRLPAEGQDEFGAWAASFNQMAEALEAKIAALSAAQERERRFTADVAHELRTPVTALVAAASLLGDMTDQLPVDARRPAELLVGDVKRLRRLVAELMEISRLSAGGADVRRSPVDLPGLVAAVLRARGWETDVRIDAVRVLVSSDPRRLETIVANLVGNALEHGRDEHGRGPIVVRIRRDGATIRLSVIDNGPGIAPKHQAHLFERFYKVDAARSSGGSGLGLALVRENIRLLGGDIQVRSHVGEGAEFSVSLPVGDVAVADRPDTAGPGVGATMTAAVTVTGLLHDGEVPDERAAERGKHQPLQGEPP